MLTVHGRHCHPKTTCSASTARYEDFPNGIIVDGGEMIVPYQNTRKQSERERKLRGLRGLRHARNDEASAMLNVLRKGQWPLKVKSSQVTKADKLSNQ